MAQVAATSKMNTFTQIVRAELLGSTPFDGKMTFAVKANTGCGFELSAATPSLRNWVAKNINPVVQALLDGGHQITAIANMHEIAFGVTSENPGYGDVDNPQMAGYIPGGSSGGSAAAVAMNAVSFSLGSDTGGSMRIPASLCGVVGYRPSTGLYDPSVVCPLSSTTDTIGIFAQDVTTVQKAHQCIVPSYTPSPRPLKGVRLGVPRSYYYSCLDKEVSRVTELALERLRNSGVELIEVDFPSNFPDGVTEDFFDLITYETYDLIPKFLKEQSAPVSMDELLQQCGDPVVRDLVLSAVKITKERYDECLKTVAKQRRYFDDYFKSNNLDGFLCPTTVIPAVKRPTPKYVDIDGKECLTIHAYTHNSLPQAMVGVPCISIPSGCTSHGLPVGLEIVAARGEDSQLLDLAVSVQGIMPTLERLDFNSFKDRL